MAQLSHSHLKETSVVAGLRGALGHFGLESGGKFGMLVAGFEILERVEADLGAGFAVFTQNVPIIAGRPAWHIIEIEDINVTIHVTRPEVEKLINQRLESGAFQAAEDVILDALQSSQLKTSAVSEKRREAIASHKAFAKTHGLTLGGITIRQLREEGRP